MDEEIQKTIDHESENWTRIFEEEIKKNDAKRFSSIWWQKYYEEMVDYFENVLKENKYKSILEAGSGSGKATILLSNSYSKTLLDISKAALKYAKYLSEKLDGNVANYIEDNIFNMSFKDRDFDFVWNIGVIEHYDIKKIELILMELVRVCSDSGVVAVGIPNFFSGPILKAWVLKKIKFISGYRLDTEKFYNEKDIEKLIVKVAKLHGKKVSSIEVKYFGSPLIMETPESLFRIFEKPVSKIFYKNKFLKFIVCKFEE